MNEDSGNRRPIMLEVTPSTTSADQAKTPPETNKTSTASEQVKTTEQQNAGIEMFGEVIDSPSIRQKHSVFSNRSTLLY